MELDPGEDTLNLGFIVGFSHELVGYGSYEAEHRVLIQRIMFLPFVLRVMRFERGEKSFWRY